MVRSITFDGKEGYIGARYTDEDKPEKPDKSSWKYKKFGERPGERVFDRDKYNSDMDRYKSEMETFKKVNGKYKVECSELLVGRTFEFSSDKINLIFGPNASGKSTVLKCIASHALCKDGFSEFIGPIDLSKNFGDDPNIDEYYNSLLKLVTKTAHTSSVVDWDGSPVYYHNFENRRSYGQIGDLQGSIIQNTGEEMLYIIGIGQNSNGETMFYQFSKLISLMSKNITYKELLEDPKKRYGLRKDGNDSWKVAYNAQERYYRSFPMAFSEDGKNTYLFDEIDKSMDILNVHALYKDILPDIIDRFGKQIIIISHSPVVLLDEIYKSDKYNFISMDEEYTEKCRNLLTTKNN